MSLTPNLDRALEVVHQMYTIVVKNRLTDDEKSRLCALHAEATTLLPLVESNAPGACVKIIRDAISYMQPFVNRLNR
jgi:hypothetical protein